MSHAGPPFVILSTCKGGGYQYARTDPPHPRANAKGLYPLHRVIAENKLGRLLKPDEIAHHADHDKSNDDPANIEVMKVAEHSAHHARKPRMSQLQCPYCGKDFQRVTRYVRVTQPCCSRRCSAKRQQRQRKDL